MAATLAPKRKRSPGAPRPAACARPRVAPQRAARLADIAQTLADPIRVQLVDVLATHPDELCACDLQPLFDVAQSTLAHHLKKLADAGILDTRREGLFVYYLVRPHALADLADWLGPVLRVAATSPK